MKPHAIFVRSAIRSLIVRVGGRPQVHNREPITPELELALPKHYETVEDFLAEYGLPGDSVIDRTNPQSIRVSVTYILAADSGIGPGYGVTAAASSG